MNTTEIFIKALREELNNLDLENLQEFKKLIDEIHALPEEDLRLKHITVSPQAIEASPVCDDLSLQILNCYISNFQATTVSCCSF